MQIRNTVFFVLGAGLTGHLVVLNLAMLGVRKIILCDPDTLCETDLSKGLYTEKDCMRHRKKVRAILKMVRLRNREVRIEGYPMTFETMPKAVLLDEALKSRLTAVLCGDNRRSFVYPASFFAALGIPVYALALTSRNMQFQLYRIDPGGGCPACSFSERDFDLMEENASCMTGGRSAEAGVPSLFSVACMGAGELINHICMESTPLKGSYKVVFSSKTQGGKSVLEMPRSEECVFHYPRADAEMALRRGMTLGDLFREAADRMGTRPEKVLLDFGWQKAEFHASATCVHCRGRFMLGRLCLGPVTCPLCGKRQKIPFPDFHRSFITLDDLNPELAALPAGRVGFRRNDVIRCSSSEKTVLVRT